MAAGVTDTGSPSRWTCLVRARS